MPAQRLGSNIRQLTEPMQELLRQLPSNTQWNNCDVEVRAISASGTVLAAQVEDDDNQPLEALMCDVE